jgi:hypothetical protein
LVDSVRVFSCWRRSRGFLVGPFFVIYAMIFLAAELWVLFQSKLGLETKPLELNLGLTKRGGNVSVRCK